MQILDGQLNSFSDVTASPNKRNRDLKLYEVVLESVEPSDRFQDFLAFCENNLGAIGGEIKLTTLDLNNLPCVICTGLSSEAEADVLIDKFKAFEQKGQRTSWYGG